MYEKALIFIPTRNTAKTLEETYRLLPQRVREEAQFIVVDNASSDDSVVVAERLGLDVIRNPTDLGYGGSNKVGFKYAASHDVDCFAILHSDCQYDPTLMESFLQPALSNEVDLVLGSRILGKKALEGGMPRHRYVANRILTWIENAVLGADISEYHTGYRVYRMDLLERIPYWENSNYWLFDSEILFQTHQTGARIKQLPIPTSYHGGSSSLPFRDGVVYALTVLLLILKFKLHDWGIVKQKQFMQVDQQFIADSVKQSGWDTES